MSTPAVAEGFFDGLPLFGAARAPTEATADCGSDAAGAVSSDSIVEEEEGAATEPSPSVVFMRFAGEEESPFAEAADAEEVPPEEGRMAAAGSALLLLPSSFDIDSRERMVPVSAKAELDSPWGKPLAPSPPTAFSPFAFSDDAVGEGTGDVKSMTLSSLLELADSA